MKARAIIDGIGTLIHSLIYTVGCFSIWDYSFERWQRGTYTVVGIALVGFALLYLWTFFVRPFRAG